MEPESGTDAFIRVVEIDPVPSYKPLTTIGWNAFELIVDDVYAVNEKLLNSPFKIIGPPSPLDGDLNFIHAMQVIGPANEVLYLTCDTTRAPDSLLPVPDSSVDRPFIAVLAGTGIDATQGFYCEKFAMVRDEDMQTPIGVLADAQGLPADTQYDMGFMFLGEPGNFIEYDGYSAEYGARPHSEGQLPPGCATVSFSVQDLNLPGLEFVGEATEGPGLAYGGGMTRTVRGAAGELIELITDR